MKQTIEEAASMNECRSGGRVGHRRRCRTTVRRTTVGSAIVATVAAVPGRVWAQIDDTAPSNDGLPGGALLAVLVGWGKWVGLIICVLVIIYGAATWRGMGGNSGRGVEGKVYVGAGMLGAMVIGLAVTAVNVLYGAGQAGG